MISLRKIWALNAAAHSVLVAVAGFSLQSHASEEVEPKILTASKDQCVILLHGLTRSPSSMAKLEDVLLEEGYSVVNQGYPSREKPIEDLASQALPDAIEKCGDEAKTIHVVTHSLGGILLRQYVAKNEFPRLGRAVMLGPPNQGSEIPDKMGDVPGFDLLNGPAGEQLGTGEDSVPNTLGPATFDVGVIAGTETINLILSTQIPGVDDGKVSVENTQLEGMADHIALPVSHPFIMKDDAAIKQTLLFLQTGKFDQSAGIEWKDQPE